MRKTLPLFLIAASAAWCQSPNPAGWGKIVWGMTVAEARAALGPAATTPTETPGPNLALIDRLMLAGIPIGNLTAEAAIQTAPGSDKVSAATPTACPPRNPALQKSNPSIPPAAVAPSAMSSGLFPPPPSL